MGEEKESEGESQKGLVWFFLKVEMLSSTVAVFISLGLVVGAEF